MKYENLLVMLSGLVGLLSLRARKWLKQRKLLSVNYQHGSDISKIEVITSSSLEDQRKED